MASHTAMHVTLLERLAEHGQLYSAFLPVEQEGRFTFQDRYGNAAGIPLYITATEGQWLLQSTLDAQLDRKGQHLAEKTIALEPNMLIGVSVDGCQYDLTVEEEKENDYVFIPYSLPEIDRDITIGRSTDSDIYYENGNVSRKHAVIHCRGGSLHISDTNSVNGTYINGIRMTEADLTLGDCVYIVGMYLIIGAGYIAINNGNNRCQVSADALRPINEASDIRYAPLPERPASNEFFNRQPRRKYELEPDPIEINQPPAPMSGSKIPLLLRMGSPALMGGRAIASGNYLMAMSSMALPFMTQGFTEKDRQEYEERRKTKYLEYLQGKEKELNEERESEKRVLNSIHPSLEEVLDFGLTKKRLWEFRSVDPDFLRVRLGTGSVALKANIQYPKESFDLEEDVLKESMYNLVKQDFSVPDAPILLPLKEKFITGICGTMPHVQRIIANMVVRLALTHSYDEVKIVLLAEPEDFEFIREEMHLFRYLPHCWDNLREIRFIADCKEDAFIIGEYLKRRIEDASQETKHSYQGPAYVIFALNRQLLDCLEAVKEIIRAKEYSGFSIITGFEGPLKESRVLLRMNKRTGVMMDLNESEKSDLSFVMERCDKDLLRESLRQVMRTRLQIDGKSFTLPKTYTFLEMFGASKVEYLNPLSRWKEKNPIKSLAAPIGIGTDGKVFYLDLHEKRQGPHGLIAGTTGSGKSEFIITYILSMAVNYSPEEVAFVLIDYKGGGLTTAFEDPARGLHLPHVVGTITNLDGATIQRALTSITSELERRQRLFNEAASANNEGKIEIYDYQRLYRAGKVKDPLPHLFLIADEFAELKKQEPEFMAALISTARIGRSLGVHLILATQKPSGTVSDEIWTNTRFRVCLKVADRSDSLDMLKRPEAAELKDTGRFYLQVGYNEYFSLGQSAWCGAEYMPHEQVVTRIDESVDFLDNVGQITLSCKPQTAMEKSGTSQLIAIVELLSKLAHQRSLTTRALWLPPLEDKIDIDQLIRKTVHQTGISDVIYPCGLLDDPKYLSQYPLYINLTKCGNILIVGESQTGKTTFIQSMLYALAEQYTPEQFIFYSLDYSGRMIKLFARLPHCGAVLTEEDDAYLDSFFNLINSIVQERKALFSQIEVDNYESACQIKPIPLVLVIVDNLSGLTNTKRGQRHLDYLFTYIKNSRSYGVCFVISLTHLNEASLRIKQELNCRIALQMRDRYDYGEALNQRISYIPPVKKGRGLFMHHGRPLEFQAAMFAPTLENNERKDKLKARIISLSEKYAKYASAPQMNVIPKNQSYGEFCRLFAPKRFPLGYTIDEGNAVALPLKQFSMLTLYFGNPESKLPVLDNILFEGSRENATIVFMKHPDESCFEDLINTEGVLSYDADPMNLAMLPNNLQEKIDQRYEAYRTYCQQKDIEPQKKDTIPWMYDELSDVFVPIFIVFEKYTDVTFAAKDSELMVTKYEHIFNLAKKYRIYLIACVYPDDYVFLNGAPIYDLYNHDKMVILFGGKYGHQKVVTVPYGKGALDKISPYNHCLVHYRDELYPVIMPCGIPRERVDAEDDRPIFQQAQT